MHKQSQLENVEVPNDTSTLNGFDNDTSSFNGFNNDTSIFDDSSDEKLEDIETNTTIHNFLYAPRIFNYENIVYFVAPSVIH